MLVEVKPKLVHWACERSRLDSEKLESRFPDLKAWQSGAKQPTFKQLEKFAKATHVPFGYFFLGEPPEERLPVPDLRRRRPGASVQPSPELLESIYAMQRRQAWLRETLVETDADPKNFIASARTSDAPEAVAKEMRRVVGLSDGWTANVPSWRDAVTYLREAMEDLGIMTVINGVVGNDTHRPLSVEEFRGFALPDEYAPLVFVNGADAKSAQMFTLAHELAHLWLGSGGVSGFEGLFPTGTDVETWCDRAAAEFLVSAKELESHWQDAKREADRFEILARRFKVSPIVVGRRALDLKLIGRDEFFAFYDDYVHRERSGGPKAKGGNFYNTQNTRVGRFFAAHVIRAALEGTIGFKAAYDLTGLNAGALQEYARRIGFNLP